MKQLSKLEEARMIKENDLFGDENMGGIKKVQAYCEELLNADLVAPETREGRKLKRALAAFTKATADLESLLEEMDGAELLPYDTEGSMPEPDEIMELFK